MNVNKINMRILMLTAYLKRNITFNYLIYNCMFSKNYII